MNASELHRKLLYCGYSDVTDYLKNSPMNRFIYRQLLAIRPVYGIEASILTIFNELYYQCVKIQFDRHPGDDVFNRYFQEESEWLSSEDASELVFTLVLALVKNKCELSFHDECFISELGSRMSESRMAEGGKILTEFINRENVFIPYIFPPMPCRIDEIPKYLSFDNSFNFFDRLKLSFGGGVNLHGKYPNAWGIITDNYSVPVIEDYLRLYQNRGDQFALLQCIQNNFNPMKGYKGKFSHDFDMLSDRIDCGTYETDLELAIPSLRPRETYESEDDYDRMFAAGYNQTIEEAENDKVEQYKQERDTLRYQLDELRKNYEAKMAEVEAKHLSEIEALRMEMAARNDNASHEVPQSIGEPEEQDKDFSLTVSEMANYVIENFSEGAANEFINLYYHFAMQYKKVDDEASKIMDCILPAIHKRNTPHTQVDVTTANQVNVNPQQVINHTKGEDDDKK